MDILNQQCETKLCERCAKRCRTVAKKNPNAQIFVLGTTETGRLCTECVVTHMIRVFDLGPSSSLGKERMNELFPDCLRAPHIQEQMQRIIRVAASSYGSEMLPDAVDWDEVIANWHLPFAEETKPAKKKKK